MRILGFITFNGKTWEVVIALLRKKLAGGKTGSSKILGRLVVINFAGRVTRGLLLKGCRTILASRTTVLTGRERKQKPN